MQAATAVQTVQKLDWKFAFHCAPVIAGLKPSNIISIRKPVSAEVKQSILGIARAFAPKGIFLYQLAECPKRVLLMVYHRDLLRSCLTKPEHQTLLRRYGYRTEHPAEYMLGQLSDRLVLCDGFPHEIGVFLGYPLCDVMGFIQNKGQNYEFCGYWKVYGNVAQAKRTFTVYDNVRSFFCQSVENGEAIQDIIYGGAAI